MCIRDSPIAVRRRDAAASSCLDPEPSNSYTECFAEDGDRWRSPPFSGLRFEDGWIHLMVQHPTLKSILNAMATRGDIELEYAFEMTAEGKSKGEDKGTGKGNDIKGKGKGQGDVAAVLSSLGGEVVTGLAPTPRGLSLIHISEPTRPY